MRPISTLRMPIISATLNSWARLCPSRKDLRVTLESSQMMKGSRDRTQMTLPSRIIHRTILMQRSTPSWGITSKEGWATMTSSASTSRLTRPQSSVTKTTPDKVTAEAHRVSIVHQPTFRIFPLSWQSANKASPSWARNQGREHTTLMMVMRCSKNNACTTIKSLRREAICHQDSLFNTSKVLSRRTSRMRI